MYLFFDTETTGLPNSWSAPASQVNNWPRMVQLACALYEPNGTLVDSKNYIIKPEGYTIPFSASIIHRITTEKAINEGVDLKNSLIEFQDLAAKATYLVAHNIEFDEKIVGAEYHRKIGKDPLPKKKKFCTMKNPTIINFCAIRPMRNGSYKWPKLDELHRKLFGTGFDEAHDASIDIDATARCFFALKQRGVI